ncbi:hypothetical protein N0V83_002418 [Neocucurbitaria cava]|uniref:CBM-cenC domain-containing protein n=1 Tax=Neocucurbitaria cava TaxID=798079 RepID=A0A9W8YHF6_9PLEO|nr:hypothetical protein N0V83_002418 [Neocucurbitaria cava]
MYLDNQLCAQGDVLNGAEWTQLQAEDGGRTFDSDTTHTMLFIITSFIEFTGEDTVVQIGLDDIKLLSTDGCSLSSSSVASSTPEATSIPQATSTSLLSISSTSEAPLVSNTAPTPTPTSCSTVSNLLVNPGFEQGDTSGWLVTGGDVVRGAVRSNDGHESSYYFAMFSQVSSSFGMGLLQNFNLDQGTVVDIFAWVRVQPTNAGIINFRFYLNDQQIGATTTLVGGEGWVKMSVEQQLIPAGRYGFSLAMDGQSRNFDFEAGMDDITIRPFSQDSAGSECGASASGLLPSFTPVSSSDISASTSTLSTATITTPNQAIDTL